MKTCILLISLMLFHIFTFSQSWAGMVDTLQPNKTYFAMGSAEKEWKDCRIVFRYAGNLDTLLHVISEQHESPIEVIKEGRLFATAPTTTPLWFYASYNAFLEVFPEHGTYTYHVAYAEERQKAHKDGQLLQGVPHQYRHFCQQLLDEALQRSH